MRTVETVLRALRPLEGLVHKSRVRCLGRVVLAALCASRLSLTQVGRTLSGTGKAKHGIKRVDVLLGNDHLERDGEVIQKFFATHVRDGRPVLLIDWTDIGTLWTSLVVTFVCDGRGLTLCWSVHPQNRKNSPGLESQMLKRLSKLLPATARPIFIADAGFRGPWLQKVQTRGWDFIARVRGRVRVQRVGDDGNWRDSKDLWRLAASTPRDLGMWHLARYKPVKVRLVTLRQKKRHKRPLPALGRRKRRNIKSAREPWLLATSLTHVSPTKVTDLYALRMRIELTFRDQKCTRFGLGLDDVRTKKLERARAYVLLAALAHYVALIVGRAAEKNGLHRDYQANTVRNRRVLSWARLGRELLRRGMAHLPRPTIPIPTATLLDINCGDP